MTPRHSQALVARISAAHPGFLREGHPGCGLWPYPGYGATGSPYNCGMRLLLQQRPDGRESPRFVQLQLEADLLGGWSLLRETGQIGGRSTLRREQFPDQATALLALEHARDLQLRKGFQLMFAQGADAPKG